MNLLTAPCNQPFHLYGITNSLILAITISQILDCDFFFKNPFFGRPNLSENCKMTFFEVYPPQTSKEWDLYIRTHVRKRWKRFMNIMEEMCKSPTWDESDDFVVHVSVPVEELQFFNCDTRRFQITLAFVIINTHIYMYTSASMELIHECFNCSYPLNDDYLVYKGQNEYPKKSEDGQGINEMYLHNDNPAYISLEWEQGTDLGQKKHLNRHELSALYVLVFCTNNHEVELIENVLVYMKKSDRTHILNVLNSEDSLLYDILTARSRLKLMLLEIE